MTVVVDPTRAALAYGIDATVPARLRGWTVEPWCFEFCNRPGRTILTGSRQAGKTEAQALRAVWVMVHEVGGTVLAISASQRQSEAIVNAARSFLPHVPGAPRLTHVSMSGFRFETGSRLVALPASSIDAQRGWSPVAIVLDECAFVSRALWESVLRPMLATRPDARVSLTTTAGFKSHWSTELMHGDEPGWHRMLVTADMCPRISPEFLERERQALPRELFMSEYFGVPSSRGVSVFASEDLQALIAGRHLDVDEDGEDGIDEQEPPGRVPVAEVMARRGRLGSRSRREQAS